MALISFIIVLTIQIPVAELFLYNINQGVTCPNPYSTYEWRGQALRICKEKPDKYHCLNNTDNLKESVQFCTDPIKMPKGLFAVYRPRFKDISFEECPIEMYQPVERMTNFSMAFKCERIKSQCNRPGQIQCNDGSSVSDRSCGCDFKKGYALEVVAEENPQKIRCVHPRMIDLNCVQYNDCLANQELNPFYQCVEKCPHGHVRQEGTFNCIPLRDPISALSSSTTPGSTTKSTSPGLRTTTKIKNAKREEESNTNIVPYIIITVAACLAVIIIIILYVKIFKQRSATEGDIPCLVLHCCDTINVSSKKYSVKNPKNVQIGDGVKLVDRSKSYIGNDNQTSQETPLMSEETNVDVKDEKHEEEAAKLETINKNDKNTSLSKKEDKTMEDHIDCMRQAARSMGMELIDVPSDGSCFYHSVIMLYSKCGKTAEECRHNMMQYLKDRYNMYKEFVTSEDLGSSHQNKLNKESQWSELLKDIATSKWADHLEIKAMSDMLNLPIRIYKLGDDNNLEIEQTFEPKNSILEGIDIGHVVIQGKGVHFVALKKNS